MAAETTSLHLRLPNALYKRLHRQARRNNVSLNTEIVNQLEGYEGAMVKRTTEIAATTAAQVAQSKTLEQLLEMMERRGSVAVEGRGFRIVRLNESDEK
jgi:hypothetical protein